MGTGNQTHLHTPSIKHRKYMLDKPPTIDSLGPQDDFRRGYKQWEPPTEAHDYINHALKILPSIEGESSARIKFRLLRLIFAGLLSCHLKVQGCFVGQTDPGGKGNPCGGGVSCRNGHDAGVPRVSGFGCVECK